MERKKRVILISCSGTSRWYLKHEPDTVAAPTNTSHEIFINVFRFFMKKLKIDFKNKETYTPQSMTFYPTNFQAQQMTKTFRREGNGHCYLRNNFLHYPQFTLIHISYKRIILWFQLCKSATDNSSKVGISANKSYFIEMSTSMDFSSFNDTTR